MEINFDISRAQATQSAAGSHRNEERIKLSKDRGLRPLLRFVEGIINDEILPELDDKYVFKFVGLNVETMKEEIERNEKECKLFKTINEIRAEHDLEELTLETIKGPGDLVLDPTFLQIYQAFSQPQGEDDGMGAFGDGGEFSEGGFDEGEGETEGEGGSDEFQDEDFDLESLFNESESKKPKSPEKGGFPPKKTEKSLKKGKKRLQKAKKTYIIKV